MSEKRPKWYIRWAIQCKVLLWKNAKLSWRRRRDTSAQLIAPFIFIFILWIFQQTLTNRKNFKVIKTSEEIDIGNIPLCVNGPKSDSCYTFLYSPNTSEVQAIVDLIRTQNQPVIPSSSIMGFTNSFLMDDFMTNNPNTTQGAYIFNISGDISLGTKQYNYVLQVNFTDQTSYGISISRQERIQMPMKLAADRAILSIVSPGTEIDVSYIEFTHPEVVPLNIVGTQGGLWFFAAIMFNFVVGLGGITLEKENKLRDVMKIMGLFDSVFWFTWFITLGILATLTVLMIIVAGAIFQFEFFLNNNFGIYFILLWLFALTMVAMAFLVSTIVKKSSSSTTIGFVIFIIGFIIQQVARYVYSISTNGEWEWLRPVLAFFSPSMLSVGLNELGNAVEREGSKGLSWSDVTELSKMSNRVITFQEMYGWLILDFFIYLLLALYLDNVLPNEYGTRRPPYYFLMPSYWTGKSRRTSKQANKIINPGENIEDEDVRMEKELVESGKLSENSVVVVNGLKKVYKDKSAVDGVYFGIESDTLFCLLGPNGAGKTTTIHMLVGFHEPSFGDATVFGNSITSNIDLVQQTMGVCPQFDILWNELTGEEHLYLFSGIKALSKSERFSETERLLKAVELEEAAHMRSSSYSGGMKRRLSVAISLIGNPKIVFLDEPTTGMDPISRRKVWDIIEEEKKGKVIILTTHSMEEADILGDRIGIMANGKLQCLGSSLHLKQKFGSGYRITIGTSPEKVDEVISYVHKGIEGVRLIGDRAAITGFMSFAIPRGSKDLVPFFKRIEKDKEILGITDLQLSLTTLEEVFLNIAKSAEDEAEHLKEIEDKKKNKKKKKKEKSDEESLTKNISEYGTYGTKESPDRFPNSKKQFAALMIKTLQLQKRDKKMLFCQIFTPIFLILLLFIFQLIINNLFDVSTPADPHPPTTPPFFTLPLPSEISQEDLYKRFAILNATGATILYASEVGNIGNYRNGTGLLGTFSPSYGQTIPFKFLSFERFYNSDNTIDADTYNFPINFVQVADKTEMDQILYNSFFDLPNITAGYIFKQLDFTNKKFKFAIVANGTLTSMDDSTFIMSPVVNMIAQNLANVSIQTTGLKSLPTLNNKVQVDIASLIGSFFYMLILLLLFPVFLSNIAYEKESRVREIMAMNGLKMSMYWIVTYIYDYLFYLCVIIFLIISGFAFQFRLFTINNFLSYFLLFFFWGHVLVALSFLCSVAFDSKKTAILTGYFAVFAIALICLVVVNNTLARIGETSISTANLLSIFPPFAVYRGLVYLDTQASEAGYTVSNLNTDVVNISHCYYFLIGEWAVLMLIWMYLEQVVPSAFGVKRHPLFFIGCGRKPKKTSIDHNEELEEPKDIQTETERVFKTVPNENMPIQVLGLQKTYPGIDGNPPKRAVKKVTFAVDDCTSFGILGHNGAGKTTLIHMLIGLFPPSNGDAYVSGMNLTSELDQIHTVMGICPQHDVIWETLTGEEHLMFYGRIKGLSGKNLKMRVKECLKKVNLYNARSKLVGSYSGGMKRRLSVAISIVGYPKVLYLDEPSTGLDPKSRQDLWKVINEAKQSSAVVLTTHSMEEAETLCDRLMIMAEGEIKCIGVSADLKSRFGEGFKLSIQVDAKHQERKGVEEFIHQLVPEAVLINALAGSANYLVPKESITLEKVFEVMEENKERLKITDWGITNTTLEEVFLRINNHSKKSKEEK